MVHSTLDTPELGDNLNRYGPTSARPAPATKKRLNSRTIDIHAHVAVPEAAAYAAPYGNLQDIAMVRYSNDETRKINAVQDKDRLIAITDFDDRMEVLDAMGIDFQIVAPPPAQCYYHLPAQAAVEASKIVNDGIASFVARRPDRLAALGTVALNSPQDAVTELTRCVTDLGMKGVQILTNVNGKELSDPMFEAFWRRAEELGALVMIHPNGFTHGERLSNYYFSNIVGNPFETTLALHHLIFSGTLERIPNLKILAVHGGGYLPAYSGRIDHAWGARQDCRAGLPKRPTEYLRKVYFDSVVFTTHQLEYLVKLYGPEKIVMGTDYPYDMCDYDPVELIVSSALSDEAKAMVAGHNAARLLGIE